MLEQEEHQHEGVRAQEPTVVLRMRHLLIALLTAIVIFGVVNAGMGVWQFLNDGAALDGPGYARLDLDQEVSIPTWYATVLLAACALVLLLIARVAAHEGDRWSRQWHGLAIVLGLMSLDEGASLHELTAEPIRHGLGLSGVLHQSWIVFGLLLVVAAVLIFLRFFLALERRWQVRFGAAAAIFLLGAVVMEAIGGIAWETGEVGIRTGVPMILEESLELLGASLALYWLIEYLHERASSLRLTIKP